jgi:hypothetical protein
MTKNKNTELIMERSLSMDNEMYQIVEFYFGKWDDMYFSVLYLNKPKSKEQIKQIIADVTMEVADVDLNYYDNAVNTYTALINNHNFFPAKVNLFCSTISPDSINSDFIPDFCNDNWLNENVNSEILNNISLVAHQIFTTNETNNNESFSTFFNASVEADNFRQFCHLFLEKYPHASQLSATEFHLMLENYLLKNGFKVVPNFQYFFDDPFYINERVVIDDGPPF